MCFRGGMTTWWWTWETPGWTPGPSCPPSGPPSPSVPSMSMLWRWPAPGKSHFIQKSLEIEGFSKLQDHWSNQSSVASRPKNLKITLLLGRHINCAISYLYCFCHILFLYLHPRSETHLKFQKHFLSYVLTTFIDHILLMHPILR